MEWNGPTYAEARSWFVLLDEFTVSDLADSMAVDWFVAERFVTAAIWHGIVQDTGDSVNGSGPPESTFRYVHLVNYRGPRYQPPKDSPPPEWKNTYIGCYTEILSPRGMPVRIRTDKDARRMGSTPGQGHQWRLREKRFQEAEAARRARAEAQKSKAQKEPKWKRRK